MAGWTPLETFGEYRLLRKLGAGAMGHVYLAHDSMLDRNVAVKFIATIDLQPSQRERFLIEARAAARLQHPNVIAVHRVGELSGRPYLVSEFVQGQSLDKLEKPVPWRRALELAIGLARGLAAAHRKGVLHRDIKPANAVVAGDGEVKLIDFGLAKLFQSAEPAVKTVADAKIDPIAEGPSDAPVNTADLEDTLVPQQKDTDPDIATPSSSDGGSPKLSRTGAVMGTPYYLAPELWTGAPATVASDIYALGALLYDLVTGAPPHYSPMREGEDGFLQLAFRVATERPKPVIEVVPDAHSLFGAIVDRCLRADPELRFPSADQLVDALLELQVASLPPASIPEGNPYRGLHTFEAKHRSLFFGRQAEMRTVVERLRRESFVLVTGDSGVGKSSLCRAGILPVLIPELDPARTWTQAEMVPGPHPLLALASALSTYLGRSAEEPSFDFISEELRRRQMEGAELVLFIDQLEELISLGEEAEAMECSELLGLLATAPGVRLLATVRSDFLTRLAGLPALGDQIARSLYVLKPMSAESIREAIVGPAQAMGVRFEKESQIDVLIKTTIGSLGGLPLLQFTLAELWDLRDEEKGIIPHWGLSKIGGVGGALARHADNVYFGLLPEQRPAAQRILTKLVTSQGNARAPDAPRARRERSGSNGRPRCADARPTGVRSRARRRDDLRAGA